MLFFNVLDEGKSKRKFNPMPEAKHTQVQKKEALKWAYDKYFRGIYWTARRIVNDPRAAEDVVQFTYEAACRNEHRIDMEDEKALCGFLYLVCKNKARDIRKKQKLDRENIIQTEDTEEIFDNLTDPTSPTPEDRLLAKETRMMLNRLIRELKPELQEPFLLYMNGVKVEAIADIADVTPGAVYKRLQRAKALLREKVELELAKGEEVIK